LKSADFDEKEKCTYTLKAGDILTIRSNGSVSLVGKCALVRGDDTKFLYAGYLIRLRPSNEGVLSEYLMACFSSQLLRRQIEAKAKSTSGVNNINSGELQALVVPLCGQDEQRQIIAEVESRLSIIDGAEVQVDANLRRADRLRQSILKQAFSGQLAPQDPNDEPASVLLERIRSTQPTQTKEPSAHQRQRRTPSPKPGAPSTDPLPMVAESTASSPPCNPAANTPAPIWPIRSA
jgi:type I restriction enzyme S subunit